MQKFLQRELANSKYISIPNLNLFPMSKYYQEFQTFLQAQISNLENFNKIKH